MQTAISAKLQDHRMIITVVLALAAICLVLIYAVCDDACAYLRGEILGFDLKYIGVLYMISVLVLAVLKRPNYLRIILASGIGVEVYLIYFQFRENVICPFCLAFGAIVFLAFFINYEKPRIIEGGWFNKMLHSLGEVSVGSADSKRVPLLIFAIVGYIFVILTFSGSTTPAYGAQRASVPSYGAGKYELILFSDYFCPPCQYLETEIDASLHEFLSLRKVRIFFVDVPMHRQTPLYAKYFLYITKKNADYRKVLKARNFLFSLAKNQGISDEDSLAAALKSNGILFERFDTKTAFTELNKLINMHGINSTPTCIIKYPNGDIIKYKGTNEIRSGIKSLREAIL